MKLLMKAFGNYQTNCYILVDELGEIVIDPGEGSYSWTKQNCKNILAILNTHGHFDHSYDDYLFQKDGYKIYIHEKDAFLISQDPMSMMDVVCKPDILVKDNDEFQFGNFKVKFLHFPGHTPGCCMIEVNGTMFSGDFLFNGSIGRYDFPFSDKMEMKSSLRKVQLLDKNYVIYPGHGDKTTFYDEIPTIDYFLEHMKY